MNYFCCLFCLQAARQVKPQAATAAAVCRAAAAAGGGAHCQMGPGFTQAPAAGFGAQARLAAEQQQQQQTRGQRFE